MRNCLWIYARMPRPQSVNAWPLICELRQRTPRSACSMPCSPEQSFPLTLVDLFRDSAVYEQAHTTLAAPSVHRHDDTSETCICIKGKLDVIFYSELPNMDAGGPGRDFTEILRVTLSPESGNHGCQIPKGVWHSVLVTEPTIIMEAKDGAYKPRE